VDHIAFNGTDFASLKSTLTAHGVKFAVNEIPSVRLRQLFMHDPNGVKIEVNIREP
jgi:hypothetical protein